MNHFKACSLEVAVSTVLPSNPGFVDRGISSFDFTKSVFDFFGEIGGDRDELEEMTALIERRVIAR